MSYIAELIDELDASVFNGDVLYDDDELKNFEHHLERWSKQIPRIKEMIEECKNNDDDLEHLS